MPQRPISATVRPRRFALSAFLAALAVLGASALTVLPESPAAALVDGPGYTDADNGGVGGLGAFTIDGRYVYCLEPGIPEPPGDPDGMHYGGWASLSPDEVARLNWAISTTGQSGDAADAAAVAMFVWSVASPAAYHSHGMSGDDWYIGRVPAVDRPLVRAILARLRTESAEIHATPGPSGDAGLEITRDPRDHYLGEVTVRGFGPEDASGILTLEHAIFEATGTPSLAGAVGGGTYAIIGTPPDGAAPYRISAHGDFVWSSGWRGEIAVYTTAGYQAIAGPGRDPAVTFELAASDEDDRTTTFRPILTTKAASTEIGPGEPFEDRLIFALDDGPDGVRNRWYRDPVTGAYLAINASCRVYGPFDEAPAPSATVPPGAPFATSFIVTTGSDGPYAEYLAASEEPLEAAGWYTAVCSIDQGSQSAAARAFLPDGYRFADGFGVADETIRLVRPETPELAATGIDDPLPWLVLGGVLGGLGAALLAWRGIRVRRGSLPAASGKMSG